MTYLSLKTDVSPLALNHTYVIISNLLPTCFLFQISKYPQRWFKFYLHPLSGADYLFTVSKHAQKMPHEQLMDEWFDFHPTISTSHNLSSAICHPVHVHILIWYLTHWEDGNSHLWMACRLMSLSCAIMLSQQLLYQTFCCIRHSFQICHRVRETPAFLKT